MVHALSQTVGNNTMFVGVCQFSEQKRGMGRSVGMGSGMSGVNMRLCGPKQ